MRYLLLLALLVGCPHPNGAETAASKPATPKDVVTAVRGAIEAWRQAYEVRSIDSLAKLYAHDLDLVVVQEGTPVNGWTAVEAMLRDRLARAKDIHVRLKDVQVASLSLDIATAVATMTREIGDGTTTVTENGALTIVVHNGGDGWRIVAEHYSYKRP